MLRLGIPDRLPLHTDLWVLALEYEKIMIVAVRQAV